MFVDEVERLVIDDRLDDLLERLFDDRTDLGLLPTLGEREHRVAHPLELLFVGAEVHVDELAVQRAKQHALRDQALSIERPTKGDHRRLRDDRLVEVEEGGLHGSDHIGRYPLVDCHRLCVRFICTRLHRRVARSSLDLPRPFIRRA